MLPFEDGETHIAKSSSLTDDVGTDPTITLEGVHDSIVSSKTLQCYMGEIIKFLLWCVENKLNWLTANGTDHIAHIIEEHGGEGVHAWRSHTHTEFFGLLHSCDESPVLLLGEGWQNGVCNGPLSYMGWARIRSLEIYFMVSSDS